MYNLLGIVVLSLVSCSPVCSQTTIEIAPGGPGIDAHWPTAAKNGFATSVTSASKVWFTLAEGVLTEVYYPRLDVPNVQTLQLLIVDGDSIETEEADTLHKTEVVGGGTSLTFRQINTAKSGRYKITKTYVTDPAANTLLIDIEFEASGSPSVYVYYDPSLNNSGMRDTGWMKGNALLASDHGVASALVCKNGFGYLALSNGFLGINDGLTELRKRGPSGFFRSYARAENGNVVQVALVPQLSRGTLSRNAASAKVHQVKKRTTLALAFGRSPGQAQRSARHSLASGFDQVLHEYQAGWIHFVKRLPEVEARYQAQFNVAAMVLHALEDKTYRGASIASPSIPWGGGPNANEATISGYHAVWARDLYHIATALIAIGDPAGANRALDYLLTHQQKPDGSFPQNTWINGRPIGGGTQMDQVAFPIILSWQLRRTDGKTWLRHIKPAADYILNHGPVTNQDRWEEKSGYSPATIAAEIAGLVCAAEIARLNKYHRLSAVYLKKADDWANNVEKWTATGTGTYGDGSYFLRISANGNPNDGSAVEINSGGGSFDERTIVDSGFLELVRLGIRGPNDPLVLKSLAVVDKLLRVSTPAGNGFYRYNHDAYGELADGQSYDGKGGHGRLWTLLTGERAEYDLANGNRRLAFTGLDALMGFANDGLMIPEQVWDRQDSPNSRLRFGQGTGSATPLAWSLAQFIRLAMNIKAGRNLETPRIVSDRYLHH